MFGAHYLENDWRYSLGYNRIPIGNGIWGIKWSGLRSTFEVNLRTPLGSSLKTAWRSALRTASEDSSEDSLEDNCEVNLRTTFEDSL